MAVEEWDRRQLCPDGGCTGVITASGVCSVCGRAAPNWGDERKRGLRNPTDAPPIVKDDDDIAPSARAATGAMADWGTRRLCLDGSCIGVIGPNNKCKVCGKPGPAKKAAPVAAPPDSELERVAAEMAGSATATDLASIVPAVEQAGDEEDDEEYEDDEDDEYEEDDDAEDDADEVSDEDHDHGDEDDADEDEDEDDDAEEADDESSDEEDDGDDEDDDADDEDDDSDDDDSDDAEGDEDGTISASGGRELCPDGACVGVIAANGRCKICNKPRDWKDPA